MNIYPNTYKPSDLKKMYMNYEYTGQRNQIIRQTQESLFSASLLQLTQNKICDVAAE